ncbi:sulfurtransferase [Microcella daejeonensis]|uniref:Sulfurtransferase n=1 Tax=Microcella daejeonensis TaxID=2994971 RepID=A0A9E8SCG0_9MICO|nr:sulfurtransferase [Microcella daejeonensis]WAB82507.1 sulfurtransferase [Microcella daejeonensis]
MLAPFVNVAELRSLCDTARHLVVVDSRWYLDGRSAREAYAHGHLPGAVFVDLDAALAAPPTLTQGRHPLPDPADFAAAMRGLGIGDDSTVVVYDDAGGVIAARLVWMLRTLGLDAAVLDGGIAAWEGPLEHSDASAVDAVRAAGAAGDDGGTGGDGAVGSETAAAASFTQRPWPDAALASIDDTEQAAVDGSALVLDARTADRFAGDAEPVDARAGHIPGAANLSVRDHVDGEGRLLPVDELRARLTAAGAGERPVISYCGSGVTACHTLLVLEHAGLPAGRLFPGSWSQYAADASRPIATGA